MSVSIPVLRRLTIAVFVGLAFASSAEAVCACPDQPTCVAYRDSTVIFKGRVLEIIGRREPGVRARARIVVDEVLSGAPPAIVEFPVDAECDARFDMGEEYLVFARTSAGELVTDICSRTRALSDALADVEAVKVMNARQRASLFGYLVIPSGEGSRRDRFTITLRGSRKVYEQVTVGGPYEFNGLRPGRYQLTIKRADDFSLRLSVSLRAQACKDVGGVVLPE